MLRLRQSLLFGSLLGAILMAVMSCYVLGVILWKGEGSVSLSDATMIFPCLWLGISYTVSGFAGWAIFSGRTNGLRRRLMASTFAAVLGCIICTMLPLIVLDIVYDDIDDPVGLAMIGRYTFLIGVALVPIALIGVVIGSQPVFRDQGYGRSLPVDAAK
ncbi:hypothetical protein L2U69_03100 [Zavarzinia compransoris]|uniref:hypothetical protein n=1 Tax=Zavarzinia marina TaxID=2911065 RepID=UPI001F1FC55B|nr:hypothetical protein [Zavarzinia marina]MCF4164631.1 hypothetical protein [Zavarzinia marina]